jgi:hypothetical protein
MFTFLWITQFPRGSEAVGAQNKPQQHGRKRRSYRWIT